MVIIVKILTAIVIVSSIALLPISDFVLNEKLQQNALPYFLYDLQNSISIIFLRGKRKKWTKHFFEHNPWNLRSDIPVANDMPACFTKEQEKANDNNNNFQNHF